MFDSSIKIADQYSPDEQAVLFHGNCLDLLKEIPERSVQLVVTSPPYNIGKEYKKKINDEVYYKALPIFRGSFQRVRYYVITLMYVVYNLFVSRYGTGVL
ncbi:MAG: hypothetical protein OXE03_01980 [Gammaproteobacteria bacterium]|nr:hypothetical protein [Gammaproteobacteria bacterium]